MKIKRKKKFQNAGAFLRLRKVQEDEVKAAKGRIKRLDTEYIEQFCPRAIGQTIPLKDTAFQGYTGFFINKIGLEVVLSEEQSQEVLKRGSNEYDITFVYYGHFTAPNKEAKPGKLRITNNGKTKKSEPAAEAEGQETSSND